MDRPKIAVLDGDIIAYRASFWAEQEGIEYLEARLKDDIEKWTPHGVDRVVIAMSCRREDNYRRDLWPDYKAHRDGNHTPDGLVQALGFLEANWDVRMAPRLEADDMMGITQSAGKAITVTIDKDLLSVPGWLWNPDKMPKGPELIEEDEADYRFYCQWIHGDSTDGYAGLWKIGPKKAAKYLDPFKPDEWHDAVKALYIEKEQTEEYYLAMGVCARILRHDEWVDGEVQSVVMRHSDYDVVAPVEVENGGD